MKSNDLGSDKMKSEAARLLTNNKEEDKVESSRHELLQEGLSPKLVDMFLAMRRQLNEQNDVINAQATELNQFKVDFKNKFDNQGDDRFDQLEENQTLVGGDVDEKTLPSEAYSMMIVSEAYSLPWFFGFQIWIFQMAMYNLLLIDQVLKEMVYAISDDPRKIIFEFPPVVSPYVSAAQVFALVVTNMMQDDVFVAAKTLVLLQNTNVWTDFRSSVYAVDKVQKNIWWYRVFLPEFLKLSQGLFGIFVVVVVILQNYTIMGLFKDFTALVFIGQIDELVFSLALLNHFGRKIQRAARKVETTTIAVNRNRKANKCYIPLQRQAQLWSLCVLFAFWGFVTYQQRSGVYIRTKYPNCKFEPDVFNEWFKLGNNDCETKYNSPVCGFDGEDCIDFNRRYPNCKADFPFQVGDGECHEEYNTTACRFDGYDCFDEWFDESCDVFDVELLGDGNCNGGSYNTAVCAFDGNDCIAFNDKYPDCEVENPYLVGNGICNDDDHLSEAQRDNEFFIKAVINNASLYMSKYCGFDGGDCLDYLFPYCDVARPDFLSNGECNLESPYNTKECGYDGGECALFHFLYPNCDIDKENLLGDGFCNIGDGSSYNSSACNYDNGDCFIENSFKCTAEYEDISFPLLSRGYCKPECGLISNCTNFADKYPECNVTNHALIGNGVCDDSEYNIKECGYEDEDCVQVTLECNATNPLLIGNGICDAGWSESYNTPECGWDGTDCIEANAKGIVYRCQVEGNMREKIGNGVCNGKYNNIDCGWDGGDCKEFNTLYPKCNVDKTRLINNTFCDGGIYNSVECAYDGGDCEEFNKNFPDCHVSRPPFVGNGKCDGGAYDTLECGFDGGDCIDYVYRFPNCSAEFPYFLDDKTCHGMEWNTEECGWDGGACIELNEKLPLLLPEFEKQFPDCDVIDPVFLFDGICVTNLIKNFNFQEGDILLKELLSYNTSKCGYDNGDCIT